MKSKVAVAWMSVMVSMPTWAADLSSFPPTESPYGWIAPVAIDQLDVSDGNAKLYRTWFDNVTQSGDLIQHSITTSGAIGSSISPTAGELLDARTPASRIVVRGADNLCDNSGVPLDMFLCGDNTNELSQAGTDSYRDRASNLGTLIHGNPVYVGKPRFAYSFDDHLTFRSSLVGRAERIYAGANDGMLHAFDSSGNEIFGYIPSMVESATTSWATDTSGAHHYLVDGPLVTGDAYADFNGSGKEWASLLVGGLGAGGKGYYALDVTTPVASGAAASAVTAAKAWEFTPTGIGFTYGAPIIAPTNNAGKWALIAPNGYAQGGEPILYIRDIEDPTASIIKDFNALENPTAAPGGNGLSGPAAIDMDGDSKVDYVYAGDLDGNLWRFDISASSSIGSAWTATKVFAAEDSSNVSQPILATPELARLDSSNVMVYFGTGDPWSVTSGATPSHSLYALKDDLTSSTTYNRANLQPRFLTDISADYRTVDTTDGNNYDQSIEPTVEYPVAYAWPSQRGWYLDLGTNEHLLQPPVLDDRRIQFMGHNLTDGNNWLTQLDYQQGLLSDEAVFYTNNDGTMTNVDDISGGKTVSVKTTANLISGQTLAAVGSGMASSYLNRWNEGVAAVAATEVTTITTIDYAYSASCSRLNLNRIRLNEDDFNNPYDIEATLSNGDIVRASIGVNPDNESTYAATPGLGEYPASAGAGEATVDGVTTKWFGMYITGGRQGSDDFDLKIHWHSPYAIESIVVTSGRSIEEIKEGVSTCEYDNANYATKQCSGSSSNCQTGRMSVSGSTITSSGTWNGLNAYSSTDNIETVTSTENVPGEEGTDGTAATGEGEELLQSGNDGHTGRLRWRELNFGE